MGKKILVYVARVMACFITYAFTLWLFNVIFDKDASIDGGFIFQSIVFAILFSAFTSWNPLRKFQNKGGRNALFMFPKAQLTRTKHRRSSTMKPTHNSPPDSISS